MDSILAAARHFHDMGATILWLHANSKRPVGRAWSTKERGTTKELIETYRIGYNVGVRLGTQLPDSSYLAAIDCDMKSSEPGHLIEMEAALARIFPKGIPDVCTAISGRGNGSRHLYLRTVTPLKSRDFMRSPDRVKVHMPSAETPSKREEEELTKEELAQGIRLRPAWEISFMGTGRQTVLPPSIHPDSGQAYAWKLGTPPQIADIPHLELNVQDVGLTKRAKGGNGSDALFSNPIDVDLDLVDIPDSVREAIRTGEEVTDHSAYLLPACCALLRAGLTDQEILSLLTDRSLYLGSTAYDHAKTEDRGRAAFWLERYTLVKAKAETLAQYAFEEEVDIEVLNEEEQVLQKVSLLEATDWRAKLERSDKGKVRPSLHNLYLIFENVPGKGLFQQDTFVRAMIASRDFEPWDVKKGEHFKDAHATIIRMYLANCFGIERGSADVHDCMKALALGNQTHQVQAYLESLPPWDGVNRVDTWLRDYAQAEMPEPYLSLISRKFLCCMVARAFVPGIKVDSMLVLEGKQGCRKSTAARILACNDEWFSDTAIPVQDEVRAGMLLFGKWVVEIGELVSFDKASANAIKSFITSQADNIRVSYARLPEDYKRQCVFIGTTNEENYLVDVTGGRRFWPVKVKQIDTEGLRAGRDQLFAEAIYRWQIEGETLYLPPEVEAQAAGLQQSRTFRDALTDELEMLLKAPAAEGFDPERFTMTMLHETGQKRASFGVVLSGLKWSISDQRRIASSLRALGYESVTLRREGSRNRYWTRSK